MDRSPPVCHGSATIQLRDLPYAIPSDVSLADGKTVVAQLLGERPSRCVA